MVAYSEMMNQKSYHVANVADKIYVNPKGFFDWTGFSSELIFLKGTLEKLDIEPQIFYAGKFKSATEPFRTDKMTDGKQVANIRMAWRSLFPFLTKSIRRKKDRYGNITPIG